MSDLRKEFNANQEVDNKTTVIRLFATAMEKLGLSGLIAELNNYPLDIKEMENGDFENARVEIIDGATTVFLPKEKMRISNPTLIEEMAHAVHLSVNPSIRQRTEEFCSLRKEILPFSKIRDGNLLAAKILLDTSATNQIVNKIEQRADLIGLNREYDLKKWLQQYLSGKGTGFCATKPEPGVVLRLYDRLFNDEEGLKPLKLQLANFYHKYQSEVWSDPSSRGIYLELVNSRNYLLAEKRIIDELESDRIKSVEELLRDSGCQGLSNIATAEKIIEAVGELNDANAAEAILKIIQVSPSRVDLEVITYNLDVELYKDGVKPEQYPFYKVPESMRLSDDELINRIQEVLRNRQTSAKRALKECLLFGERTEVGASMIEIVNALKFNDYPIGAGENSIFFSEAYQREIAKMIAELEPDEWKAYASQRAFFDIPLAEEAIPAAYSEGESRLTNIAKLKEEALARQNNYYYQNSALGLSDGWQTLQIFQDLAFLDVGDKEMVTKAADKVNEILLKRVKSHDEHAEINMMSEPIAKLIAQLANNGSIPDIYFEEDSFLEQSYSWILTSQNKDAKSCRDKLLSLLEAILKGRDARKLLAFLKAANFSQQLALIEFNRKEN